MVDVGKLLIYQTWPAVPPVDRAPADLDKSLEHCLALASSMRVITLVTDLRTLTNRAGP